VRRRTADRDNATRAVEKSFAKKEFTQVSLEPLMRFLTALDDDIEIKIGAGPANKAGEATVKDARRSAA